MEKIAQCEVKGEPKRALLSLATGAGKTFIAVNLLKRISDAGQLKRALFVCDRDELRTQALKAFQDEFGADAAEVHRNSDGANNAKNARIHVATYQTLGVDKENGDASFLTTFYPEDYFTHVVIDECHRSAWGKWSEVLRRNRNAVQIGLTATPRQIECKEETAEAKEDAAITANNIEYFGEPAYEYDIAQAIEDGYLAACEIQKGRVNLDDTGITKAEILARNPVDALTGQPITADQIEEISPEDTIRRSGPFARPCHGHVPGPVQLPPRNRRPRTKDHHLLRRATGTRTTLPYRLNNLYAKWCAAQGRERLEPYAFKCTAASSGNDQLPDLRGSSPQPFHRDDRGPSDYRRRCTVRAQHRILQIRQESRSASIRWWGAARGSTRRPAS